MQNLSHSVILSWQFPCKCNLVSPWASGRSAISFSTWKGACFLRRQCVTFKQLLFYSISVSSAVPSYGSSTFYREFHPTTIRGLELFPDDAQIICLVIHLRDEREVYKIPRFLLAVSSNTSS